MPGLPSSFTFSDRADRDFSIELDPRSLPEDPEHLRGAGSPSWGSTASAWACRTSTEAVQARGQPPAELRADARADRRLPRPGLPLGQRRPDLRPAQAIARRLPPHAAHRDRRTTRTASRFTATRTCRTMFKAQRRIHAADLPDAAGRLALLRLAIEELTASGYRHIGMDHFALPDDELVACAGPRPVCSATSWATRPTRAATCVGLGVSAISRIGDCYGQNLRDLRSWERAVDSRRVALWRGFALTRGRPRARQRHRAADVSRTHRHPRPSRLQHGIDFGDYFAEALARSSADACRRPDHTYAPARIKVTGTGRVLLRNIAMCFDRYLAPAATDADAAPPRPSDMLALPAPSRP